MRQDGYGLRLFCVGIARPPAFPTPYLGGKSLRMAKIRLMTRETKRTAPPQIACGGNISSPACIPRPSNHQARSNVRTYVCTRPTRMCLAASEAYVRTYVRTYTINEVATTALPLHHPRPGNIWEDRSPPRARRPQSPPDSPSTTYVRSSVRPLRTPVSPYVRTYVRSCFSKDFLGFPTFCWDLQFNNNPD